MLRTPLQFCARNIQNKCIWSRINAIVRERHLADVVNYCWHMCRSRSRCASSHARCSDWLLSAPINLAKALRKRRSIATEILRFYRTDTFSGNKEYWRPLSLITMLLRMQLWLTSWLHRNVSWWRAGNDTDLFYLCCKSSLHEREVCELYNYINRLNQKNVAFLNVIAADIWIWWEDC